MKKILLLLLVLILVGCTEGEPEKISSELPQSSTVSAVTESVSAESDSLPEYMTRMNVYPETISEPLVDTAITEDMIDDDLFSILINCYNAIIMGNEIGISETVSYFDAMSYMAFYGYARWDNDILSSDYSYYKFESKVVDDYLCSIFNTKIDRSKLRNPTVEPGVVELFGYIPEEDCYIIHFQIFCPDEQAIIRSIEKGEDGVYTIRADYEYYHFETVDGELRDYSYPIYDQIFKIQIKDGSFKYLSVEYLKIYSPEIEE